MLRVLQEQQLRARRRQRDGADRRPRDGGDQHDLEEAGRARDGSARICTTGSTSSPFTCRRLRERGEDLPLLVHHYLRRFSRELGKDVRELPPETMELLRGYPWPGNIRELQSVFKQAMLRASGPVLLPDFLPPPPGPQEPAPSEEAESTESGLMELIEKRFATKAAISTKKRPTGWNASCYPECYVTPAATRCKPRSSSASTAAASAANSANSASALIAR